MALDLFRSAGREKRIEIMGWAGAFSEEQKEYLDGFLRGLAAPAREPGARSAAPEPAPELPPGQKARLAWLASGKRLSKEEKIKFDADPLDCWPRIQALSARDALPEGEDVFRFKFHGLWNVSPAQQAMMCRLRIPGGVVQSYQAEAIARCAREFGGGYADITTRANLQIREIPGRHMAPLLMALHEAGIIPRGSGADNVRNVTGNPTCGIDPHELIDVLPLCRELHHRILHDRTLYGLPRKFNVAFDGGNSITCLEDTNDMGFKAVRVEGGEAVEAGVYFRLALGGITGHGDLARDSGLLLKPEECVPVVAAMLRVFMAGGDLGNRKKARLKYVLDAWGLARFLAESEKQLGFALRAFPLEKCRAAAPIDKAAHLGIHPQRQAGLFYIGVDVPVGRLSARQLSGLARIAARLGSGTLRLTVWQNLLIPGIAADRLDEALEELKSLGLSHAQDAIAAGLVACTGNEGCKFGQAPTKATALAIRAHLQGRLSLDIPVNIHVTGCPHSCAQHFIGDIGLLAVGVDRKGYRGPGFHFYVGGGYGAEGRMAVPAARFVPAPEVPAEVERILAVYLERRLPGESFAAFAARQSTVGLQALFAGPETGGLAEAPLNVTSGKAA